MAKVVEFGPIGQLISKTLNSGVNESTVRAALATAAGPVSVNNQKVTNLAAGVSQHDAVRMDQLNLLIFSSIRPAGGNVYTDFDLCYAARGGIVGPAVIYVETDSTHPAIIPGNSYNLFETSIIGPVNIQGTIQSQIQFMEGIAGGWLKFSDGAKFIDTQFTKGIFFQSESSSPIFDRAVLTSPDPTNIVIFNAESCMFQLDNLSPGTGTSPLFPSRRFLLEHLLAGVV